MRVNSWTTSPITLLQTLTCSEPCRGSALGAFATPPSACESAITRATVALTVKKPYSTSLISLLKVVSAQ